MIRFIIVPSEHVTDEMVGSVHRPKGIEDCRKSLAGDKVLIKFAGEKDFALDYTVYTESDIRGVMQTPEWSLPPEEMSFMQKLKEFLWAP